MPSNPETTERSWLDNLGSGFGDWLAAQPADVQANEQYWWDLVADGLLAWLVDQPPEVSESMTWQQQIALYFGDKNWIDTYFQEAAE